MAGSFMREWWFFRQDRQAVGTTLAAALFSVLVIALGLADTAAQRKEIKQLIEATQADVATTLASQPDPGSAAYYTFRMALAPPTELAFASRGLRDELPWKHRLRILALEGQIYEVDADNPELKQLGDLDFSFVLTVIAPLLLILILHDSVDSERRHNRLNLLIVTAGTLSRWLFWRAAIRTGALALALVLPFVAAAILSGTAAGDIVWLSVLGTLYVSGWGWLVVWIAKHVKAATVAAALSLGVWTILVILVPLTGAAIAEARFPAPAGGEILLQQREHVNDAWDLPRSRTMQAFAASHPEWAAHTKLSDGFDWKWYYAFQQLGDESVADKSEALRDAVRKRDQWMQKVAIVSPSLFVDRQFSRRAGSDVVAFQAFDQCVREYHEYLRRSHYPMLFNTQPFDVETLRSIDAVRLCD